MQKEYKASVVLSLVMPSGRRVVFDELSGGNGSVFTTNDVEVQQELEEHPWFGTRFKLRATKSAAPVSKTAEDAQQQTTQQMIEIEVSDPGEAKEWLAEHYQDVSRTKLRTKEAIVEMAKMKGVIFKGL